MSNRVYCDISISTDGYLAGPGQTADKPFGDGPYHAPVFVLTHHPRDPRCAWSSWRCGRRRSQPLSATASSTDSPQPALVKGQVT